MTKLQDYVIHYTIIGVKLPLSFIWITSLFQYEKSDN